MLVFFYEQWAITMLKNELPVVRHLIMIGNIWPKDCFSLTAKKSNVEPWGENEKFSR
jgi:hypothetical protein